MSYSRILHDRFQRRALLRKIVAVIFVVVSVVYLAWRTTIINQDSLSLSIVYFSAEVIGFILGLALIFCSWNYRHREPPSAPNGLNVDVFIPTYNEPLEIIRWTLIAAKEINYQHQTFVLDDGNRPEIKALAEELGIRYLVREQNLNAKAGNLNHGLAHSTADFVMVFDADHIALPHALNVTLGFFEDERVALVQTPQDFYNIDAFQFFNARRTGGLWHDGSFFSQVALPCRDWSNGASCIGSGVVYRRSAIDAIGGIPTDTVTEDVHTSLKLHKAGYEVVFLADSVAYGIGASDIRDFYRTRHRWAYGNIHALVIENILLCKGLTLGQRLSYLTLGLTYLEGWQQLLLFVVPIASLLLGWAPFEITVLNVIVVMLFPLLATVLLQELGCGLSRIWVNEIFSVARFPVYIMAWGALFWGKIRFRPSTKFIRGRIEWKLLMPQLIVCAASLAAFSIGVIHLAFSFQVGPLAYAILDISSGNLSSVNWNTRLAQGYTLELVAIAGFWALFNAAKTAYLARKAIVDARRSTDEYRFAARLPLEFDNGFQRIGARVDRISTSWISVRIYGGAKPVIGDRLTGYLHLPAGPLAVECVVRNHVVSATKPRTLGPITIDYSNCDARVECDLVWPDVRARDLLARSLYSVDWHREFMHRNAFFSTPLEVLGRLLSLRAPFATKIPIWSPVLFRHRKVGNPDFAVLSTLADSQAATLLTFRAFSPGSVVEAEVFGINAVESRIIKVLGIEPLRSLGSKGLDGAIVHRYRIEIEEMVAEPPLEFGVAAE